MCSSWVKANRLNRSQSKHTHAHHQKAFNFKENKQRCSNGMPTLAWAQELQPIKKQLSGWRVKYLPLELPGVEYWEVSRNFRGVGRFVTSSRGTGEASFTRELKGKNSSSDSPLSPKSIYIPGHAHPLFLSFCHEPSWHSNFKYPPSLFHNAVIVTDKWIKMHFKDSKYLHFYLFTAILG